MMKEPHNQTISPENADAALTSLIETMRSSRVELGERISAATALGIAGGDSALSGLTTFLRVHDKAPPAVREAATLAIGQLLARAQAAS